MEKIKINFNPPSLKLWRASKIEKKQINLIVGYFKKGKVVVYPTDTIYGLGCVADNKKAIDKIYKIKKREKGKALLILVSDLAMVKKYCYVSEEQEKFLKKVWQKKTLGVSDRHRVSPARPVTVILKSKGILPKELTGGADSLAVRLPQNEFLVKIIKAIGAPIVSTSANLSGKEYDGSPLKIKKIFKNKIDLFIDAGKLNNRPSRIVDITDMDSIKIIRK